MRAKILPKILIFKLVSWALKVNKIYCKNINATNLIQAFLEDSRQIGLGEFIKFKRTKSDYEFEFGRGKLFILKGSPQQFPRTLNFFKHVKEMIETHQEDKLDID